MNNIQDNLIQFDYSIHQAFYLLIEFKDYITSNFPITI